MPSNLQKRVKESVSFDDFGTPYYATDILIPYLKNKGFPCIWEPANGWGFISDRLMENGFEVYRTDIKDSATCKKTNDSPLFNKADNIAGGEIFNLEDCKDFLEYNHLPPLVDCIVTNPPYSLKDLFLAKCYSLNVPFALLMPLRALGAGTRVQMYKEHGIELLVPDKRIDFIYQLGKESNWFHAAWYCHNILPEKLIFTIMEK
ncbi:MAG: hypothetical protein SVT56_14100 [Chloroflexota bacterium]|nr:hypothetical protein [Chloroflexota bacterium]